jgi:alpha-beta hydrolase superfamily lysophospholipase
MPDSKALFLYEWVPEEQPIRGIVQLVHGMAEHALRYEELAWALTDAGFAVIAHDQRGHGQTAHDIDACGDLDSADYETLADDVFHVRESFRDALGRDLPVYLFGHSMGSFIALRAAQLRSRELAGLVLCGSNGRPSPLVHVARLLLHFEIGRYGPKHRSTLIDRLFFGQFNRQFQPNRTIGDWLSRDATAVDAYLADPYCGFVSTAGMYDAFFRALLKWNRPSEMRQLVSELPVRIIYGTADPVGERGKGIRRLERQLREAGVRQVEVKAYEGARHELLQETNTTEVIEDFITWLSKRGHVR